MEGLLVHFITIVLAFYVYVARKHIQLCTVFFQGSPSAGFLILDYYREKSWKCLTKATHGNVSRTTCLYV